MVLRLAVVIIILLQSTITYAFVNLGAWQDCNSEYQQCTAKAAMITGSIGYNLVKAGGVWTEACMAKPDPARETCVAAVGSIVALLQQAQKDMTQAIFRIKGAAYAVQQVVQRANNINLGGPWVQVNGADQAFFLTTGEAAEAFYRGAIRSTVSVNTSLTAALTAAKTDIILRTVAVNSLAVLEGYAISFASFDLPEFGGCVILTTDLIGALAGVKFVGDLGFNRGNGGNGGPGGGLGGPRAPGDALGPDDASGTEGTLGDGGSTYSQPGLIPHPTFAGDWQDFWVDQGQRFEENGRVFRIFKMGYALDEGAYLNELLDPITGEVLIPDGTPIVIMADYGDGYPVVRYNPSERRLEVHGYGLALHLQHAGLGPMGAPMHFVCADVVFEEGNNADANSLGAGSGLGTPVDVGTVNPGQYQRCTMRLETTGSPTEVALEEIAEKELTILSMGGNSPEDGDGFFRMHIRVLAPKEEVTDPCYVWDDYLGRYVFDPSVCEPEGMSYY